MNGWTIFYWAWWISWAPFVGTFIAKISRGRTIRQLLLGGLILPTLYLVAWHCIFGGAALRMLRQYQNVNSNTWKNCASNDANFVIDKYGFKDYNL